MKLDNFKTFLAEEEKPYKLLILSHDDPLDPNETGPLVRKKAQELGIQVYLAELMGCYMEEDDDSYEVDDDYDNLNEAMSAYQHFINQGFIRLNDFNLQILLFADLFLLVLFFTLIKEEKLIFFFNL